ncbi:MAG TPA: methyltransferase domain-containing protein, partial [Terriglobia bacterium]|nr:methyltransferase domain-containing protein [Terriglobia bacterium]
MTRQEMERRIEELKPWFYPFDFGDGLKAPTKIPPEVEGIFETRLEMAARVAEAHFGPRLPRIACLDIGCHEGFYSFAMARKGVGRVVGVDVRESNLRRARFVAEAMGYDQVSFRQRDLERLLVSEMGQFELTLFLGVLYHLENPMLCLRNVAALTKELCIIETQVIDEVEGETEWGARAWKRPYQGALAVIDESGEYHSWSGDETGSTPIGLCPSPKALLFLLRQAGFRRVEVVPPPPGAYEQLARGKR